ncbi:MAG: hypothetical protein AAFN44_03425 [Pseudomonadota bacterium]
MAKKNTRSRVQLVWPKTGALATPMADQADAWLAKGWELVEPAKEADNGNKE